MDESLERILVELGKVMKQRRKVLRLTQAEFAEQVGLHRTYVADLERGVRNVSMMNLCRIATAFGMTVSQLVGGIDTRLSPIGNGRTQEIAEKLHGESGFLA
jgi:transcriptional regulator with XRE-family HTH domain